jgi:hypothetical protein
MKYPNKYLLSKGVNKGDKISFKPESEYEFMVDDEKLYRMYDHQITWYYELRGIKKRNYTRRA